MKNLPVFIDETATGLKSSLKTINSISIKRAMKKIIFLILLSFFSLAGWSQDHFNFFKTIPPIDETVPAWAKMMYTNSPNVYEVDALYQTYYKKHDFKKSTHTQNYKNWKKNLERGNFIDNDGQINIPNYEKRQQLEKRQAGNWLKSNKSKSGANWSAKGPFETRSRDGSQWTSQQVNIYTIDQSASNPNIVYSASETGAIFKSTDKGQNWNRLSPGLDIEGPTTIKVHPTNPDIVYTGRGDN
ncbi:MAG: hypothetical protein V3V00_08830, partial [Saprospiraceae bacterium]